VTACFSVPACNFPRAIRPVAAVVVEPGRGPADRILGARYRHGCVLAGSARPIARVEPIIGWKVKNPEAPTVAREAEEEWGR
jgi:hypothetical protein